jgi:hypothetical protein
MGNTLLLYQVANLKQRDVEREVASRQVVNQAKTGNNVEQRLSKRLFLASETFLRRMILRKQQETFSTANS